MDESIKKKSSPCCGSCVWRFHVPLTLGLMALCQLSKGMFLKIESFKATSQRYQSRNGETKRCTRPIGIGSTYVKIVHNLTFSTMAACMQPLICGIVAELWLNTEAST